jgi:hypothetical protein
MTDPVLLRRELLLLGEAISAVGQCCLTLGDARTNGILGELSGVRKEVEDRLDAAEGAQR